METVIDIGNKVYCDGCNTDWTENRGDKACEPSIVFCSKGYCPNCTPEMLVSISKYHEEDYIRANSFQGEAFCDFILRVRDGNNTVRIIGDAKFNHDMQNAFNEAQSKSQKP